MSFFDIRNITSLKNIVIYLKLYNKRIIYLDKIRIKTLQTNVSIEVKALTKIIFVYQANFLTKEFAYKFILQTACGKVYRLKLLKTEIVNELIETITFYETRRLKISAGLIDLTN